MKSWLKILLYIGIGFFALVGVVFFAVFIGMQLGIFKVPGSIAARNAFFFSGTTTPEIPVQPCIMSAYTSCSWNETPEWVVVKAGLTKDSAVITKVAGETGIPARLLAAVVIPEQIRFFTSEREVFKRYFEPLKILGSLSQFSLGVSGIKQETATQIEEYAADQTSPRYPGIKAAVLLVYPPNVEHDAELFRRLTDEKDHYYSYLYTALFLKEVMAEWNRSGYDLSKKPDVLVTLFNIGFERSKPNPTPKAAGADIALGGRIYPFGVLGGLFYDSNELTDQFPK